MKLIPSLTILCSIVASVLVPVTAQATLIFSENFNDTSDPNTVGFYFRNSNGSGNYWAGGATVSTNNPFTGNALRNGGGSGINTVVLKQFTPLTLSSIGDSVSVNFGMMSTIASTGSGTFNVSLLTAAGTVTANSKGDPNPIPGATGYAYKQTVSATPAGGFYDIAAGTVTTDTTDTLLGAADTLPNLVGSVVHNYTYRITKVGTGAEIQFYQDNVLQSSYIDTDALGSFQFNTLKLGTMETTFLDNISVSFVPEPSSAFLILSSCAILYPMMRRRRSKPGNVTDVTV